MGPEPIVEFKGFIMSGTDAARDAKIVIDNAQGMDANGEPIVLNVDFIECAGNTACADTTFVIGANVNIVNVKCAFGACVGCMIKESLADAGMPCDVALRTTTTTTSTSAPAGVIEPVPVVVLPVPITLPGISLPGIGNGIVPPPTTATTSPPLAIVLPPLPGMVNPSPAPAPAVPSTTAKVITLPIPVVSTQTP